MSFYSALKVKEIIDNFLDSGDIDELSSEKVDYILNSYSDLTVLIEKKFGSLDQGLKIKEALVALKINKNKLKYIEKIIKDNLKEGDFVQAYKLGEIYALQRSKVLKSESDLIIKLVSIDFSAPGNGKE